MDCDSPIYGKTERMAHQDCEFVFLVSRKTVFLEQNCLLFFFSCYSENGFLNAYFFFSKQETHLFDSMQGHQVC